MYMCRSRQAHTLTLYKRSSYFVGAKLWNDLPRSLTEQPDIFSFKAQLKALSRIYVELL